jgi:SAM-dependent methyltransferase
MMILDRFIRPTCDAGQRTREQDAAAIIEHLRATTRLDELGYGHENYVWYKYLNIEKYVPFNVRLCHLIGLHSMPPQRVLDIGCGGGLFMYCARYFGHDPVGIDVENELLGGMAEAFGVDRRIAPVKPYRPASIEGRYDLITCIATGFNRYVDANGTVTGMWSSPEWRFFLSDLERLLNPDGRVFLRLNRGREAKEKGEYFYDERLGRAFAHGNLRSTEVLFDRAGLTLAIQRLNDPST